MREPGIHRRQFLGAAAASSLAFTFLPRRVWGANDPFYVGRTTPMPWRP